MTVTSPAATASGTAPATPVLPAAVVNAIAPLAAPPPKESVAGELKEYVAAALSVAIIGLTLYFLIVMFGNSSATDESWKNKSALLQVALSLAGTVTGYYFGRIPAERAAASAQQSANNAQQAVVNTASLAQQATANEQRIRAQVSDLKQSLGSPMNAIAETTDVKDYRLQVVNAIDRIMR